MQQALLNFRFQTLMCWLFGLALGIVLLSFFGYHVYLVCTNTTTHETVKVSLVILSSISSSLLS